MSQKKNVIVFYTDQQRADSLGFMGNPLAKTPNLDSLASKGTFYTNHYATNPLCMPSRASFITGCYPQVHRVFDNGIFLPESILTMPSVFQANGYRTASVGKLHFQSKKHQSLVWDYNKCFEDSKRWREGELDHWFGPYYGFEKVKLTIGHNIGVQNNSGHYGRWRSQKFPDLKIGPKFACGDNNVPECHCWKSSMPLEVHHSTWVADNAIEFLENKSDKPFYLNVSFPDPHRPYSAPAPYHSIFDETVFPLPHAVEGENQDKPEPYRTAMTNKGEDRIYPLIHYPHFKDEAYQMVMAQTQAMIKLIDDSIGRVLAKLEEKNLMKNTIIVFTSDHGDFLGDHHFFAKAPIPCRSLLNIPLIIIDPDELPGKVDTICSNVDVMPTLLKKCDIDIPEHVQGVVLPNAGEGSARDYAFECAYSTYSPDFHHFTIYEQNFRISIFPHIQDGELYDLNEDPFENRNLFNNPTFKEKRHELMEKLLYSLGNAEPKKPGTSR